MKYIVIIGFLSAALSAILGLVTEVEPNGTFWAGNAALLWAGIFISEHLK